MRNGKHIRPLALLLSAALLVTQLPAVAMAENRVPEDGSIASFAALPGDVEKQAVTLGTELSALELPDTVKAAVYHVTADTAIPDEGNPEEKNSGISTATPSEAGDGVSGNNAGSSSGKDSGNTVTTVTTSEEEIPVTWGSEPAYDGDRLGDYVFTADVGGYVLSNSAKLPQITVTVSAETVENPTEAPPTEPLPCTKIEGCTLTDGHEGECVTKQPPANSPLVKTVTGWTFMDDDLLTGNELSIPNVNVGHQADFDTVVSMLPTQISAEIDGETEPATLDITGWNCLEFAKDSDGNWPLTGEYTFTAKLQEGYVCEPLPTVKVLVGGAEFYGNLISGDGYTFNPNNGELTVTNSNGTVNWKKNSQISREDVRTLILGSGVTAIEDGAFSECVNLGGTLSIPANMTSIGTNAFASTKITSLDLSNASNLETIDNGAFTYIATLSTVKIPRSVKSIGQGAFQKTALTSVDLSEAENLTYIGVYAFEETDISSITIPSSVTTVDNFAFFSCSKLTSVTFTSQSAPTLGTGVFDGTSQNLVIHVPDDAIGYDGANWPADKMVKSPTLTLTAAPEGSQTYPGSVTLTATLSGASGGNAEKTIQFTGSGSVTATTNEYGVATYIFTDLTPGTYNFGASFAGDTGNNPATAVSISGYTVSRGAQEALTLNGLASAYTYGGAAFALSTSGGSGNGTVSYTSSNGAVASVAGSQVTILKAGTFTITATKAADDHYSEAKVTSNTVTVHPATPDMSLTATGGTNINDPIILTATVSKVGTGTMPTGTVIFSEGGTKLGTVSLDGSGKATCTVSNPDAGSHTYTAAYSGQTDYYSANSTTHDVGVGLADQTGFAITDPGAKTYGDGDFTLTATGGQSAGGVSFSVPSGNGVLTVAADGKVTITGAGKVTVTATKAGDSTYNQATATREITVAPRNIFHVTVNVTGSRVYTGSQLQPVFEVKDGALAVTTGDYTNNYGPNVDAGAGAGVITLTGQRNYTGTKMATFDIEKRPLTGATITLAAGPYTHTGGEIKPAVTSVMVDGITVPTAELDVGYANNTAVGTATVTVTAKADGNFSGTASTTFEITGSSGGGGGGSSSSDDSSDPEPQGSYKVTGDSISRSVSRSDLKRLADTGKSLTLACGKASMTFEPAALKAILAAVPASAGSITFAAAPADLSAFPDAAKLIGSRPVYSFTISYKNSRGITETATVNFPAGSVSIALDYTPVAGEATGSLFAVYVDGKGAVTWLDKSSFADGKMLAEVPHFSVYGVAYKAPAPVFTDITNHWAKEDMEFVAARGLLSGTGNNLFSPDGTMTRGMFVTALGRLAGVNPQSYKTRSFTDVKANAYYAAYVEWAAQKNIVKGTGDKLFSPDAPVTREQMAVMMTNYAGQTGYSIPAPLAAVTFTDNGKISAWAAKEVAAMQRAGIVKGKDGNIFDPQGNATRAEVSAVLRRFVEIVIDPATATGWVKNDSGHWLYYQGGKALTGWQTIGKLRYYFNADGVMHEGWKQDTGTGKWYYWTNAGAATGWREIGGKWYYFNENGIMAVNTKVDGYEIGPDGARKE